MEEQIELLKEAYKEAKEYDARIGKVDVRYNFNTQNVTDMSEMFSSLISTLSHWVLDPV